MPNISSLELQISSGAAGTTFQTIERAQNVGVGINIEKTQVRVLGRFKPLSEQPVVNFVPVQLNCSFVKSSKEIESNFGLLNTTGVGIVFANTNGQTIDGFGARNFQLLYSPNQALNYLGQINVSSGVLTSYSVSASVSEPAKGSFSCEALDMTNVENNNPKVFSNYQTNLVIPENVRISGIDVSGYGLSGITTQSFDLNLSISRQSAFRLGARFPQRIVTDMAATIAIRGFYEGNTTSFSGLSTYQCGYPYSGTFFVTLLPGCDGAAGTTYTVKNPYLDSVQIGSQVGSFTSVDLQFSLPISIISGESVTGSNLIIT